MKLRYPKLSVEEGSTLAHATAYTETGDAVGGHLAIDQDNRIVFVVDQPSAEPGKE